LGDGESTRSLRRFRLLQASPRYAQILLRERYTSLAYRLLRDFIQIVPIAAQGWQSAPSMKVARRRQDADVAGVADFLRGVFAMGAAVVVEREPVRHRLLASWRVIGKADQIV